MSSDHSNPDALFHLGRVAITAAARRKLTAAEREEALRRHASGDWGEVEGDDAEANDRVLGHRGLVSWYRTADGTRFVVVTDIPVTRGRRTSVSLLDE